MITDFQLRQILQGPYQRSQWVEVYPFLFKEAKLFLIPQKMPFNTGNSKIKSFVQIGYVNCSDGEKLLLFEVEVCDSVNMRQTRVAFNNSIATKLAPGEASAAIGIFYNKNSSHYRFSFVRKTVSFSEDGELKSEQTNSKRYTYVLGQGKNCATAVARFLKLHDNMIPSLDDVEEAFSVEALTKEFYLKLFDWYLWALSPEMNVHYPDNANLSEHIIRLITRLMFVWFIKEKDLVPDNLFRIDELDKILNHFDPLSLSDGSYYNGILQNLFFATLNSEVSSRHFVDEEDTKSCVTYGVTTLYRDQKAGSYFKVTHNDVKKLFSKIPFLNGGLFDCLDRSFTNQRGSNQVEYHDGFSRERNRCAFIPNALFFDPEKGLIPLLSSYNFTIEESSPDDLQVALDPELLGKVFENLLGSYNEETQTTARNQSGSFYTPREIVNYMVDESLIAALGGTEDVRNLFSQGIRPPEARCKILSNKIKSLKILDPACGSGAFPMGILNRMVDLLTKLNEEDDTLYDLKLHLIENCIYGVDLQPIATQISKLRFFISLICECKRKDTEENFGIPTLPNLETKFVAADTLLAKKEQDQQRNLFEDQRVDSTRTKLLEIRHKLFGARKSSEKKALRAEDKKLRERLAELLAENAFCDEEQAKQLAAWNPYDLNASASFFDTEWMFGLKDGFDIVIGNPPYIQLQSQSDNGKLADRYKNCQFETFARMGDIYCLFYERGVQLLKDKGHLCYITSNTWMRGGFGETTRKFFAEKTNPKLLIDFAGEKIFESATVNTNILLLEKTNNDGKTRSCVVQNVCRDNLSIFIQQHANDCSFKTADSWVILSPIEQSIKNKIERIGTPLKDWNIQINYGIKTGSNEAFIITEEKRDEILGNCKNEAERKRTDELIRPILRGRDIKRYSYTWANLYLIATFPARHYDIEQYPAVKKFLLSFEKERLEEAGRFDLTDSVHLAQFCQQKLAQVGQDIIIEGKAVVINGKKEKSRKQTGNKWFETQDQIGYWDDFSKQKILWGEISDRTKFMIDEDGSFYNEATTFLLTGSNLIFLVCYLNSSLSEYLFSKIGTKTGVGTIRWKKFKIEQLMIPVVDNKTELFLSQCLNAYKNGNITLTELEFTINDIFFKKFSFSDEEIEDIRKYTPGRQQE